MLNKYLKITHLTKKKIDLKLRFRSGSTFKMRNEGILTKRAQFYDPKPIDEKKKKKNEIDNEKRI